jgi:hypothetical protein
MQEEKLSEGRSLNEGGHLLPCVIHDILGVLHGEGFEAARMVDEKVSAWSELPGGSLHWVDIFTVLADAIKTNERSCIEQHLAALVDMLNESISEAQNLGALCEAVLGQVAQPTEQAPPSASVARCASRTPALLLSASHWVSH